MTINPLKGLHRLKQETTTITYAYDGKRKKISEKKVVVDYIDKEFYEMAQGLYSKIMADMTKDIIAKAT